jgi:4-hydroxybenzoate polyprenyltransferase
MYKKVTIKLKALSSLMRLDKPVGIFLLLWPTLSAFFVLTKGEPTIHLLAIFVIGTVFMRSAGCVINDYFDREIDGSVERTKDRPIVSGLVSPNESLLLFFALVLVSAALLFFTNLLTFFVAFFIAFAKRFLCTTHAKSKPARTRDTLLGCPVVSLD